ncbi:MAG: RIP metalloprotease RseP [Chitinophagaceae bacterium]|jgi:regulator of sigma E protease|nr:RIP metalloprotease RseP [Chitinophagaceae bacterium]MCF8422258.1 RIP metalloprotease RseP [Chitinophagaceae bacterium]
MYLAAIDLTVLATKTAQFILSFSIIVVLHELGHFIPARLFGARVEKFYLFFNPGFSLWKKKIGDTEYGLGWIPFGGYVKIAGMIDESMDKEQLNKAPESYELRSKPAYQRLIVMLGGVIVNVILAIVIFIGIAWFWGDEFLPAKNLSYGIHPTEISKKMGLKEGDIIMSLDQKELKDFFELESKIVLEDAKTIQVKRGDSLLSLAIPTTVASELSNANNTTAFVLPLFPVIVDSIGKSAVMVEGNFQKNDTLLSINGQSVKYQHEFIEVKKKYSDSLVTVIAKRGMDTVTIRTLINNKAQLGLFVKLPMQLFKTVHQEYSFAEAIPTGIQRCFTTLDNYVTGIKQIFTGKVNPNDSLGSLISIGNTFPSQWDWERFWTLTAVFSIVLGFMNVLPIPALDGGHALFILFEMITGRKPSDKFMEYAQIAGMILMFGLMLYALGLDFWRLFK